MRNLKKILALVLALVMSLSLMATAGATDFKDDENISDTYRQAAQVLSELGVFNGDQNGQFNPEKPITRAEVAAILYRIATGDTGLENNKTYAPYNQFPDVSAEDWYAGYVTYCANAGYIKGRNTGRFDARDNVTGYEVLAMILRAVGYDKNNEFVGSNWQQNTASLATQKGVLRNVLSDPNVKLSEPATREVVAELLFRASLLSQVTWNAATLSYVEGGETLAYENLGMEQVEGVVVANEWADLRYDYIAVNAGQTILKTADGERTLAVGTDLTDIGESRYAYVVGPKVLGQLENTGRNVTRDCADLDPAGGDTYVSALAGGLNTRDAEYFINFSDRPTDVSAYRIEYSVSFRTEKAKEWFETEYLGQNRNDDPRDYDLEDDGVVDGNALSVLAITGGYYEDADGNKDEDNKLGKTFTRVIPAGEPISSLDKAIMNGIFSSAASFDSAHEDFSKLSKDIVHTGYVYAGTKSNPNTADRKDDLSDDMTYPQFAEQYIGTDATVIFNASTNGGWLKIIDNNGDGKAEYVLKTQYALVEVTEYNDRLDAYYFSIDGLDTDEWTCALRDSEYEFAVGDMLLVAPIDGQLVIEEAESEVLSIEKYSWKDVTVTTTDGRVLEGSGTDVVNGTEYDDILANIPYNTQYEVFYDHYGFIRAFRPLNSDRNYGLLTDMYLTDHRNTHYIDSQTATVELSFLDENGKLDMKEYDVFNHSKSAPNVFVGVEQVVGVNQTDNLQRAMAHLGLLGDNSNGWWADGRTRAADGKYASSTLGWEFDYDHDTDSVGKVQDNTLASAKNGGANDTDPAVNTDTNIAYSETNVARYALNEDGTVTLTTAAEFAYDKAGNQLYYQNAANVGKDRGTLESWKKVYKAANPGLTDTQVDTDVRAAVVPVYAVDYVMLDTTVFSANSGISSGSYRFKIDSSYSDAAIGNSGNLDNWHVNAVNDTVFYVVTPSGVYPYVGYRNLPSISGADGNIKAMYAVARNVTRDNAGTDYWVADVVVIELANNLQGVYSHMIYNVYDNYRAGQRAIIHELNAIDCVTGEVVSVIVDSNWNQPYANGFYLLSEAEAADDGTISAKGMVSVESRITDSLGNWTGEYADYGIHAGEIVRSSDVEDRGSYIEVFDETTDKNTRGDERYVPLNGAPWYEVYASTAAEAAKDAGRLYAQKLVNKDYDNVKPNGHEVIYVTNNRGQVVFLIDTSFQEDGWTPVYLNEGIKFDENDEKVYTDKGVYNVGMVQQSTPAPTPEKEFTISFVSKTAVGDLAEGEVVKTVKADKGENVLVPQADIDKVGYTTGAVELDGTALDTTATDYLIPNVQGNTTVEVTYTVNNKTLSIAADGDSSGGEADDIEVDGAAVPGTMQVGKTFTVTFTAVAGYDYTYTVNAGTAKPITVTGTTGSFDVTMPDANTTITITDEAAANTALTITVDSGATASFTTEDSDTGTAIGDVTNNTANHNVLRTAGVSFTIELTDETYSLDKVTYTQQNGTETPVPKTGDVYTVPQSVVAEGLPIAIDVVTHSATVEMDLDLSGVTGNISYRKVGDTSWTTAADGDTITVTYGDDYEFSAQGDAALTVDDSNACSINTTTEYRVWKVENITGDVTITVEDVYTISFTTDKADITVSLNGGTPATLTATTTFKVVADDTLTFANAAAVTVTFVAGSGTTPTSIGGAGTSVAVTTFVDNCTLNVTHA